MQVTPLEMPRFGAQSDIIEGGRAVVQMLTGAGVGLEPHEDVLDVGCGIGRVAIPLTDYLTSGTYEGLDVEQDGIAWCADNITPRFPNFGFKHLDVASTQHRPDGGSSAGAVIFPYEEDRFDLAFLISVFTHLLPDALDRYLSEIGRVVRPGGRLAATFFLLTEESREAIKGQSHQPVIDCGGYSVLSEAEPEWAVAFPESDVLDALDAHHFTLCRTLTHGTWFRGERCDAGLQDLIVTRRSR